MEEIYYVTAKSTGETWETADEDVGYSNPNTCKPPKDHKEFYMTFMGMMDIVRDKDMHGIDMRVLLYLCERMDSNGWVVETYKDIAAELGCRHGGVSDAVNKMVSRGYVKREKKGGKGHVLTRVCHDVAGRGTHARKKSYSALESKITRGKRSIDNAGKYVGMVAEE